MQIIVSATIMNPSRASALAVTLLMDAQQSAASSRLTSPVPVPSSPFHLHDNPHRSGRGAENNLSQDRR
jgi:hypothetical protein